MNIPASSSALMHECSKKDCAYCYEMWRISQEYKETILNPADVIMTTDITIIKERRAEYWRQWHKDRYLRLKRKLQHA